MFAYCNNNPIRSYDPTGEWTFSINLSIFVGFGGGYSFNIGVSFDSNDMVAFQYSYSVPNDEKTRNTVIGASVGLGISIQYTELDSVDDLQGAAKLGGINTPILNVDSVLTKYSNENIGLSLGLGKSVGADFHVNETQTYNIGGSFHSPGTLLEESMGW